MPTYTVGLNDHHHARIKKMYAQDMDIGAIARAIPCTPELVEESISRRKAKDEAKKVVKRRRRKADGDSSAVVSEPDAG